MTARPPDLNNIRYLLEVADSGSFAAAARRFGVPPSMVSRKIARLEQEMGARLFQRTTRSVNLTDEGSAFLSQARVGMQALLLAQEALEDLKSTPTGRVRLTAPAGLADTLWATMSEFLRKFPEVRVELELADRRVDLIEERFDMAIRSGPESRSSGLVGRRLFDAPHQLFASPRYLKAHGSPRTVAELKNHACVILGTQTGRVTWTVQVGKRSQNVIVDGHVAINEARVAAACAADGFGIAFLPVAVCLKHLAAGSLLRVLPRASGGERGLWLVYPNRQLPAAGRAFAVFLVNELHRHVSLIAGH